MEVEEITLAAATIVNVVGAVVTELIDDEENETVLEKVANYSEVTIPNFNDNQFKQHFRLTRETFEYLLQQLGNVNIVEEIGRPKMLLEKKCLICLWYLGNMESFRSVACRFGIGKHCAWYTVNEVCSKLIQLNLTEKFIALPVQNDVNRVTTEFEAINGFPGIVGAIDGCHIEIEKPVHSGNSYINRKGFPSVLLQGICDANKLFLDVYTGEPGSIHDQRLFTKSDIFLKIRNNEFQFVNDSHFIGDLAYKLSKYLIVGFKDNGHLTRDQIKLLNQNRVVIENAYRLLKGRWRRLKKLETKKMHLIPSIIVTACIFHNICIRRGDLFEIVPNTEPVIEQERVDNEDDNQEALMKRDNLMNLVLLRNP